MQRCKSCILPYNYPQIKLNNKGVCNFCENNKVIEYKGDEKLKNKILSYQKPGNKYHYDCIVGFSGGRDSTYLLYYLSRVLGLNIIALTVDNGNVPIETQSNIMNITKQLNIKLVTKKYDYLEKCFKHHLKSWTHKPSAAMVSALCVGCRLGLARGKYETLLENKTPVFISGGTPFEGKHYKTNIMRIPAKNKAKYSLILGYIYQVLLNRMWITNPYSLGIQIKEFAAFYGKMYDKKLSKKGYVTISPYWSYIKWEEEKIIDTIENKLGWKRNKQTGSTWRGDCDIALLKLYLYKKLLGFNDKDDSLSDLIRDGQVSRYKALQRLESEQYISEDVVKNIIEKYNINYKNFQIILKNYTKSY